MKNIAADVHTSEHVRIGQANFGMKHSHRCTFADGKLCIRKHYKLTNLIIAEWIGFLCRLTFSWSSNIQAIDSWIQAEHTLVRFWKKWGRFAFLKAALRATWRAEKEENFLDFSTEREAMNPQSKKQAGSFFSKQFFLLYSINFIFCSYSTHNFSAPQQFASWSYDLCLTSFDCYSFIFPVFSTSRKERKIISVQVRFSSSVLVVYVKPKNLACKDFLRIPTHHVWYLWAS